MDEINNFRSWLTSWLLKRFSYTEMQQWVISHACWGEQFVITAGVEAELGEGHILIFKKARKMQKLLMLLLTK